MIYSKNWNKVELMFKGKAFKYTNPNMLILPKKHALKFVYECRKNKIPIWGIDGFMVGKDVEPLEGFTVTEKSIQPTQDYSIDFSQLPYSYTNFTLDEIYDKSITLITESPDHMHFEIGCDTA